MTAFFFTPLGAIVAFLICVIILKNGVELIEGIINVILGFVGFALIIAVVFVLIMHLLVH